MTNLEALKAKISYPLTDNAFKLALTDRGLLDTSAYTVANKRALELAQADLHVVLVSAPDVQEGGYQITLNDKKTLISVANGLYSKYGVPSPFGAKATFKQPW